MKSLSILIPAALLIMLVGCTDSVSPPIPGRADPYTSAQVNFTDPDLHFNTAVGQVKLWRDSSQLLHVDVPIRNTSSMQMSIDYRVTYLDQNGIPLAPPTGWTAISLSPNVFQDIQVFASSIRATDFRMDLRYAQ